MNRRAFVIGAAALAVAPAAAARRLGGMPTALVTADLESHVAAVDLSTGRVVRRIRTMPGPNSIESAGQTVAVVAHAAEGALTLIDGSRLRVLAEIGGFGEPRYTALERTGRYAYITDSARGELVTVDVPRRRIAYRTALDGPARHLSLHPSGATLWASLGNAAEVVAVLDLADPRRPHVVRNASIRPPFVAHDVVFAPGGKTAWVTAGHERRVAVYDVRRRRLLRALPADAAPQHVAFARGAAYVASGDDGLLRVHALGGRLRHTERIPVGSYNVQHDWNALYTPSLSQGILTVVARNGRVRSRVRVGRSTHDACFVMSA